MTNAEKYKEQFLNFEGRICKDFIEPVILKHYGKGCENSKCPVCQQLIVPMWLQEEYKEPEVDWSKVAVDTQILVRGSEDEAWERRYFCRYEDDMVYAWNCGTTSWSNKEGYTSWKYVKLATDENVRGGKE